VARQPADGVMQRIGRRRAHSAVNVGGHTAQRNRAAQDASSALFLARRRNPPTVAAPIRI
jgi:hypothetical protein